MVSILRQIIKISLHWEQPSACFLEGVSKLLIGSLTNNDGDGYENVTWKVNSGCVKLNRTYSISFNPSNFGNFFLELNSKRLYRSSGKEKESRGLVFTFSKKGGIRTVHIVVVQWRQRNVQKKRDTRAKLLFCQSKPIAFLPSSLTSPSSLHKLRIPLERFHMTPRRPYWCSKTMNRRPCWGPKPILWELNSFLI